MSPDFDPWVNNQTARGRIGVRRILGAFPPPKPPTPPALPEEEEPEDELPPLFPHPPRRPPRNDPPPRPPLPDVVRNPITKFDETFDWKLQEPFAIDPDDLDCPYMKFVDVTMIDNEVDCLDCGYYFGGWVVLAELPWPRCVHCGSRNTTMKNSTWIDLARRFHLQIDEYDLTHDPPEEEEDRDFWDTPETLRDREADREEWT